MNRKKVAILISLTFLIVVATIIIGYNKTQSTKKDYSLNYIFPDLKEKINDVHSIKVLNNETEIKIKKIKEEWVIENLHNYPARFDLIRSNLISLATLKKLEPKTKRPELYKNLHVEDTNEKNSKSTLITIKNKENSTLASLLVGKRARIHDHFYVRPTKSEQAWLAQGLLNLRVTPVEWAEREILNITPEEIQTISVSHENGHNWSIAHNKDNEKFEF